MTAILNKIASVLPNGAATDVALPTKVDAVIIVRVQAVQCVTIANSARIGCRSCWMHGLALPQHLWLERLACGRKGGANNGWKS